MQKTLRGRICLEHQGTIYEARVKKEEVIVNVKEMFCPF